MSTRKEELHLVATLRAEMLRKLRANREKDWGVVSCRFLLSRLKREMYELERALDDGLPSDVLSEAADVANFAAMVADVSASELHYRLRRAKEQP